MQIQHVIHCPIQQHAASQCSMLAGIVWRKQYIDTIWQRKLENLCVCCDCWLWPFLRFIQSLKPSPRCSASPATVSPWHGLCIYKWEKAELNIQFTSVRKQTGLLHLFVLCRWIGWLRSLKNMGVHQIFTWWWIFTDHSWPWKQTSKLSYLVWLVWTLRFTWPEITQLQPLILPLFHWISVYIYFWKRFNHCYFLASRAALCANRFINEICSTNGKWKEDE